MNTRELKQAAKAFGADLVGIAPVERLAHLAPEHNPLSVFPQAKSLIVVGRRIPRGALRGLEQSAEMKTTFDHFGLKALEDNYLAKTTYDVCVWIEAQGYEAVPMFGYDVEETVKYPLASPVSPDKPAPNVYVDWRLAAQAAGLGEIGVNGLFLTPEYGTRQRIAMLLSDFEFDADPVVSPGFCADCRACIGACPYRTLTENSRDDDACRKCGFGAVQTNFGRFETVDRVGAPCGRGCLASLEARGMLKQKFNRQFRQA